MPSRGIPALALSIGLALPACESFDSASGPADAATNATDGGTETGYRRRLTIKNVDTAQELGRGYVICARISSTDAGSDLSTVRLVGPKGDVERTVEAQGQFVSVCGRLVDPVLPNATEGGYSIRYRGASVPLVDPSKVYDLYDDFAGSTLDPNKWTQTGTPAPTITGGMLVLPMGSGAAGNGVLAVGSITTGPLVLEMRVRVANPGSEGVAVGENLFRTWFGFQNSFVTYDPWTIFISRAPNQIRAEHKSVTACPISCDASIQGLDDSFHVYRIERRLGAKLHMFIDDVDVGPDADDSKDRTNVIIRNFLAASDVVVDWVRARMLAKPEPEITVGNEEPVSP